MQMNQWYHDTGDMRELLPTIPDNGIDLAIMDFPYESLEKHRAVGSTTRLQREWFDVLPNKEILKVVKECYRTLAPRRHAYFFCDAATLRPMWKAAELVGFNVWKPLIWDRMTTGMGYHYRACHEFILFCEKPWKTSTGRQLNDLRIRDILPVKLITPQNAKYPTEKPVPLMEILITQSTSPGEIVLDPCVGSGATMRAALNTRRRSVSFDSNTRSEVHIVQHAREAGARESRMAKLEYIVTSRTQLQAISTDHATT